MLHGPRLIGLLVVTLGLVAGPAAAAEDWTVKTAANDFGTGRPDYRYTIDPGGQVEDGIVVANRGATMLHLALSAAGAWVRLDQRELTVPPGESVQLPFAVAVPGDAAPGDYAGRIVTSLADRRVGLPIRLRVGGALRPSLAVERLHVDYAGTLNPFGRGSATVTYTIRNTGNATLSARQALSLGRWAAAPKLRDSPALLPGRTWKVSVPLHGVIPAVRLTATVTLVALLTDAAGSVAPLTARSTSAHAWTVPWSLLVVIALCGLGAGGVWVAWRRRPRT